MGKKLLLIIVALVSLLATPSLSSAQNEAGSSAMLKHPLLGSPTLQIEPVTSSYEVKKQTIRAVLQRYNSPLTDSDIDEFIAQCKALEMDCYFMPSIWGVESLFCTAIAAGTNNCNGWGGGYVPFPTFKDNIKVTAQGLKTNYIGRGAMTIEGVGSIYAASGAWPTRVRNFMAIFKAEEARQLAKNAEQNQLLSALNAVK